MKYSKIASCLLLGITTMFSCVDEPLPVGLKGVDESVSKNIPVQTRASSDSDYEILQNPYRLEVMQHIYDVYSETPVKLAATDLYVKFMPKDSIELHRLKYDYELELFDYPLDIELAEGEVYVNDNIPETDLTWLYTTVSPDFGFPSDISYEILDECYIPKENETVGIPTKGGEINVEDAAFALVGYKEMPSLDTKASNSPSGTINVFDDYNQTYRPVQGVKVRCHRLVKWATAYTDEYGKYQMPKSFRYKPHYAIVFDNVKGFDIWGNWGPLARANYNMGWQSNTGYSAYINSDCEAWKWAVVNNAAYEYYNMCGRTGIPAPPAALKIWVWKNGSSAPMLRRINDPIGFNGNSVWPPFFVNIGYDANPTLLNLILKFVLPDITIGTTYSDGSQMNYKKLYGTVNHELAHSSHFVQVGSPFWAKYITYIITYGAYGGSDAGKDAQRCGIGEMWGYFMGDVQEFERFTPNAAESPVLTHDGWIYPQIFWDLYKKGILTKKQIFNCLEADVYTYNALVKRMYDKYPAKAAAIESVFKDYPAVKHNVSLPGSGETNPGEIVYDTFCSDQTINSSILISGTNVLIKNTIVRAGAELTINADGFITINQPFIVERGAKLLMMHGN